jgi:hypothetical protein
MRPSNRFAAIGALILLPTVLGRAAAQESAARTGLPSLARQHGGAGEEAPAVAGIARAVRATPSPPRIDGRLDDPAWALAPVYSGFTQREPHDGQPATERTEFRVLYTDEALYVAVRAFDSQPDRLVGQLTRRDANSPSDWVIVMIDSYHDRRTAFDFWVNPAGVKRDLFRYDDVNEDLTWDAVWDVATSRDASGWTAEYRIPFSQLRFPRAESHTFGFNVARQVARTNELVCWKPLPQNVNQIVSLFGALEGIEGVRPPRRLEVQPYTVGRASRSPAEAGNPFRTGSETAARIGADVKYGVTSNLTLDATINPDFGQVEADPAVVNLTAFESFFGERRPFFTEGANIFRFPIALGDGDGANEQLFYTRRIGRAPQAAPDVPPGGFAQEIGQSTIQAAGKLSGKTPSGWTVGLLGARTAEMRTRVQDSLGARSTEVVEPATNYLVGRLARDFRDGRTVVGLFGTALHRELTPALDGLRSSAYSLGLDWTHRIRHDTYQFRGWAVASEVRGSAQALLSTQESSARYFQRPGRDHGPALDSTRTSLGGFAGQAEFGKVGGGRWRFLTALDTRSPGFEVNDIGYMRDADRTIHVVWVGYRETTPGPVFLRYNVNVNYWNAWDYGWNRLSTAGNVNGSFTFRNYWGGYLGVERSQPGLSTGALRGGPALRRNGAVGGWGGLFSDERKKVRGELNANVWREDGTGSANLSLDPYLGWRPSGRVDLSVGPSVSWNRDDWQYLDQADALGARQYLFAHIDQTTVGMTVRANVTFTPNLSLQVYAQPFVSAGRYSGYKRAADPGAARYADRWDLFGPDRLVIAADGEVGVDLDRDGTVDLSLGNPDFTYTSFRSNVVLRWEYRPGSTIFVVWQQDRSGLTADGRFTVGGASRDLVGTMPTNVFLVKVNYWLSL